MLLLLFGCVENFPKQTNWKWKYVSSVVSRAIPLIFLGFLLCLMFGLAYFIYRVHPYRFILFFVFMAAFPCFGIVLLLFVYQKPENGSSNENGNRPSSKENDVRQERATLESGGNPRTSKLGHNPSSVNSDIASQQQRTSVVLMTTADALEGWFFVFVEYILTLGISRLRLHHHRLLFSRYLPYYTWIFRFVFECSLQNYYFMKAYQ